MFKEPFCHDATGPYSTKAEHRRLVIDEPVELEK